MMPKTAFEVIKEYAFANGFDGLYFPSIDCSILLEQTNNKQVQDFFLAKDAEINVHEVYFVKTKECTKNCGWFNASTSCKTWQLCNYHCFDLGDLKNETSNRNS